MSIFQSDGKGGTAIESRYSITLSITESLYDELIKLVPEERLEEVIMEGIKHAIKREKCRNAINNRLCPEEKEVIETTVGG